MKIYWWRHCQIRRELHKEHGITSHSFYAGKPKIRTKPKEKPARFTRHNTVVGNTRILPPIPQPRTLGINGKHWMLNPNVTVDYDIAAMGWHVKERMLGGESRMCFIPQGEEEMFEHLGLTASY